MPGHRTGQQPAAKTSFLYESLAHGPKACDTRHPRFIIGLRGQDKGGLWEHFVLNELMARLQPRAVHYWRTKQGREIDFVLCPRNGQVHAIEYKLSEQGFDHAAMSAFRRIHRNGRNSLVCRDVDRPFDRRYGTLKVRVAGLEAFVAEVGPQSASPLI